MAQLVSNAGQARSPLMEWSGRAPALPATNTGGGHRRQGARHVTETRHFANRDRHRYRQELVPHRGPRSARRNRAAAEVVTRPGSSTARQPATVLNRYGGLRRRASSQSQAPNARPRRPTDARKIRAPLTANLGAILAAHVALYLMDRCYLGPARDIVCRELGVESNGTRLTQPTSSRLNKTVP